MPFDACSELIRVFELSKDRRSASIDHQFFGNDKMAHGQFKAVIKCGCERERPVGREIIQPTRVVLPVDSESAVLEAPVSRPHFISGILNGHAKCKSPRLKRVYAVRIVDTRILRSGCVEI